MTMTAGLTGEAPLNDDRDVSIDTFVGPNGAYYSRVFESLQRGELRPQVCRLCSDLCKILLNGLPFGLLDGRSPTSCPVDCARRGRPRCASTAAKQRCASPGLQPVLAHPKLRKQSMA